MGDGFSTDDSATSAISPNLMRQFLPLVEVANFCDYHNKYFRRFMVDMMRIFGRVDRQGQGKNSEIWLQF